MIFQQVRGILVGGPDSLAVAVEKCVFQGVLGEELANSPEKENWFVYVRTDSVNPKMN